jgi:hypothetical protein
MYTKQKDVSLILQESVDEQYLEWMSKTGFAF